MSFFMRSLRQLSSAGACALVFTVCATGCGDNPAGPDPATSGSAKPGAATAVKKPDPLVTKTFKAESCYYGALSLKLAHAAYTDSLGGGEPGADKIPDFGAEPMEAPPVKDGATPAGSASAATTGSARPAPAGSGKPATAPTAKSTAAATAKATAAPTAKATTAPTAKATAAATPPAGSAAPKAAASGSAGTPARDPASMARIRSVPYERFVRACHVAAGNTKDLPAPELDAALKEFADFALPLSKTIAEANAYYQKEEFKTDDFAKGKEFHKKLTEGFGKLDGVLAKVESNLTKFKAANPIDTSAYTESQKLSAGVVQASTETLTVLVARPFDQGKLKEQVTKLDAAIAPLRKYAEEHKEDRDPWVMLVAAPADSFCDSV